MQFLIRSFSFVLILLSIQLHAQETPLLDRDLFFGNPEISSGQLSPDGKWISFMKEYNGIMNIWVKKFDAPFEAARPLTDSPRPLYGYFWTKDGKYILYAKDKDGDENINVFAVNPMAEAQAGSVPNSRNLTPVQDVTARIYAVSDNDPDLMMIGLNDRDKAWHDLYSLEISSGEMIKLYENRDRVTSYEFDWEDSLRLLSRTDEAGNTTILRLDKHGNTTPIYETDVTEQAYVAGWNKDNSKFYLVSNKGDLDLSTLFLMDPETKELEKIEEDPKKRVDFGGMMLDDNTREIVYTSYTDDKKRYYWKNKEWEKNYNFLKEKFPEREISFQSYTNDYSKFLISVWGDKYPSESYFFNTASDSLIFQYTPRPELKEQEEHLAKMQPIRYKSSDGLEIPAYLTIPNGKEAKNLPVVVLVHGGPKGPRDNWGYNPIVQFLANRGYAVLQPNFRASGGYGKAFLNAGDLEWGKLMQDDITWGVKHLIAEGIANPSKVGIMGGSYGGYATLAGLVFTPDLYACGVDIVGPSNLFTLLESIPAYWEAGRAYFYGMIGDPETEEGQKRIREASPLFHADKIKKPLLIIQGANDPRVKQAEADQIVIALRDKNKQVDYLLADDEGHGFAKAVNRMAMFAETEKFLAEILGGRYQKEMSEDVAKRLEEIRVNIDDVTYEPIEKKASVGQLPEINNSLKKQSFEYDIMLKSRGQEIPMKMTRSIEKYDENNWLVKDLTTGPMGEIVDEMFYTENFVPVERKLDQSGQKLSFSYAPDKVVINILGKDNEIEMDAAYIADAPGLDQLIAGFNLKEDFELVFEMPDMNTMKSKQMKLKVLGREDVNNNKCWKVEILSRVEGDASRTTLWINQKKDYAEKIEQFIPEMGDALIITTKK
ncbi:MAG: alpha/beta fold hydrolase [Chitinophagales bacterium]